MHNVYNYIGSRYLIVGRVGIHDGTLEYSVFIDFPLEKKIYFPTCITMLLVVVNGK